MSGGVIGVVLGTGPSLLDAKPEIDRLQSGGVLIFGVNNTFEDFRLDAWIACDPKWHQHYGQVNGSFEKWHWDREICKRFGYNHIQGVWMVDGKAYPREQYETPPGPAGGLWLNDKQAISLNHCSSAQALNLACHYDCDPILLVGHDFRYEDGKPRHYFTGLSDKAGEYPAELRKFSEFDKQGKGDDLLAVYKRISETPNIPRVVNCTPGSALPWFEMGELKHYCKL